MEKSDEIFDLICIGAGGAGIACSRRAKKLGAKVALIEQKHVGGTCVNYGCFPMKLIDIACDFSSEILIAQDLGYNIENKGLNWHTLKTKFHDYIKKISMFHTTNVKNDGIKFYEGNAKFMDKNTLELTYSNDKNHKEILKGKHIVICTGSKQFIPKSIIGIENCIGTDEIFDLNELPKNAVIVGADPIGTELATMLNLLGIKITLLCADKQICRVVDKDVTDILCDIMKNNEIVVKCNTKVTKIDKIADKKFKIFIENGEFLETELIIRSLGRMPNYEGLSLEKIPIKFTEKGVIQTDEFDNTNIEGIYAIGDSNGKLMLAPVAIAQGRWLSMRLFGNMKDAKVNYDLIPSVIFSHPPMAKCGLTEEQAIEKYGKDKIKIYRKKFDQIHYAMTEKKVPSFIKLICLLPDEKIIGIHTLGKSMDENIEGFAIAMKNGLKKKDLDTSIGVHITVSEEFLSIF